MSDGGDTETTIVLVRHGESTANAGGTIAGWRTCGGLSPTGRDQCRRLAERVSRTGELAGSVLVSSQFARARQTAEYLAGVLDTEPLIDEGFGEIDPGEVCDGMRYSDFVERFGEPDWERLTGDPNLSMFPEGETMSDFSRRIAAALDAVVARYHGRRVVVTTHGGVVDAAMRVVTGSPPRGRFSLWSTNTSLTQLVATAPERHVGADPERWRIDRYNDAAHLQP